MAERAYARWLESAYNGKRIDLTDNCSQYGTGFKPGYKCQVPLESGVTELALEIDRPGIVSGIFE